MRLGYKINGNWAWSDVTFTEAGTATTPALTAPSGPGPLSGSTQFTWNPGAGLTGFYLRVGITGPGSTDIYQSGTVPVTTTAETVNIPSNGANLFVRLGYQANGVWAFEDYNFSEGGSATLPALTTPSGPSTLSGSTQFQWSAGVGGTQYYLRIGTSGPGSSDIFQSGALPLTVNSQTPKIPSNGNMLYVRLGYLWQEAGNRPITPSPKAAPRPPLPSPPRLEFSPVQRNSPGIRAPVTLRSISAWESRAPARSISMGAEPSPRTRRPRQ